MNLIAEQRRIAGHADDVGIALDIAQVDSLDQRILHASVAGSLLTEIDLRALAVVIVVVVLMMQEPSR